MVFGEAVQNEVVTIGKEVFFILFIMFCFIVKTQKTFLRQTSQSNIESFAIQDDRTKNKFNP